MARGARETKINAACEWAIQKGRFTIQEFCEKWDVSKAMARVYITRIKERLEARGIALRHVSYYVVGQTTDWEAIIERIRNEK